MKNPILLFDGVCNLCNQSVQFIVRKDKKGKFRFASLQSDVANQKLKQFDLEHEKLETLVLIKDGKAYLRSDAALEVLKILGGVWSLCYVFKIIPSFIRDAVYRWVAKNRYRWFGKQDQCMIPTQELRERFLG